MELPYDYISVLNIAKVDKNNTYSCKATNEHGEDLQKVQVRTKRNVYFDVLETPKGKNKHHNNQFSNVIQRTEITINSLKQYYRCSY